jgi:ATP-dependent RNA helicase RhlE
MLDMGFLPDLKRIISQLPERRQSLFFSATLPPGIVELAKRLLRKPVCVNVTPESPTVEKIEQRVAFVERGGKQALLRQVLASEQVDRALVFTRTKRGANVLAEKLIRGGILATAIHGNKSQNARQNALAAFQRKQVRVLVATDVAARGIDIDGITHVVNFDLPHEPENYVHRIGRTGRAGGVGIALSFCSETERRELSAIEKFIGKTLDVFTDRHRSRPHPARTQGSRAAETPNGQRGGSGKTQIEPIQDDKPKRKRRRGRSARQRVRQTS